MKAANRSGAAIAVIVGDDERASGTAVVRVLRDGRDHAGEARRPSPAPISSPTWKHC